jgi:hypothetical protein
VRAELKHRGRTGGTPPGVTVASGLLAESEGDPEAGELKDLSLVEVEEGETLEQMASRSRISLGRCARISVPLVVLRFSRNRLADERPEQRTHSRTTCDTYSHSQPFGGEGQHQTG